MVLVALGKSIKDIPREEGQLDIFTQGKPSAIDPLIHVQNGCFWIRHNWESLKKIMHLVHRAVDNGEIVQRGDIYTLAKQAGMTISEARELKRDNNLWSVIARYMVMLNPRLARAINFRESGIDTIDLIGEWHSIVNGGTTFLAVSWHEAKDFCAAGDACTL